MKGVAFDFDERGDFCYEIGCGNAAVAQCEECGNQYCGDHSSTYEQFTRVDYNCCEECYESIREQN